MRLLKKYLYGAKTYHAPPKSLRDISATPQSIAVLA